MTLSVDELAHSVLMPSYSGPDTPRWLLEAIGAGLGGVCYFGHNVESAEALRKTSDRLHDAGPVLTAVDEEGGSVSRFHGTAGSPYVGAAVLGRADEVDLTESVAHQIARGLRASGVDLALAPVADVNTNPSNPVIGVRSFGAEPALVARHASAFVTELQAAGVAACAKHFPGHGDTAVDSHLGLPVIEADPGMLRDRDLAPFAAVIAAGTRCVMTAHIVFRALDSRPATVSPAVIGLLRDELGFDGVVVSDAMDMRAVSDTLGFADAVVSAVAAGVDLVALGNPENGLVQHGSDEAMFAEARDALVAAVESGEIPESRIVEAARRVRELGGWCRGQTPAPREAPEIPGASDEAAARALRTRGQVGGALTGPARIIDVRNSYNRASGRSSTAMLDELRTRLPGSSLESAYEPNAGGAAGGQMGGKVGGTAGGEVVLVTETPGRDDTEDEALDVLLRRHPEAIVVCLGWVAGDRPLALARRAVFAYGDSLPTARAVADLLTT